MAYQTPTRLGGAGDTRLGSIDAACRCRPRALLLSATKPGSANFGFVPEHNFGNDPRGRFGAVDRNRWAVCRGFRLLRLDRPPFAARKAPDPDQPRRESCG